MYLNELEKSLTNEYLKQGYIIRPVANLDALEWIRAQFLRLVTNSLKISSNVNSG
jgi:hypothetical protein